VRPENEMTVTSRDQRVPSSCTATERDSIYLYPVMLKALFFRKRTPATYKGRNASAFADVCNRKPAIYSFQDWSSEDSVQATSERAHSVFAEPIVQTDIVENLEISNENKKQPLIEQSIELELSISPNRSNKQSSQSKLQTTTNGTNKRARVTQDEANRSKLVSRKGFIDQPKEKKNEHIDRDIFDIFDFPISETDGVVELLKPHHVDMSRKPVSEITSDSNSIENAAVMRNHKSKKRIARLRAEKITSVSLDDEDTSSQLSDELESYMTLPLESASSTISSSSQNVDTREAELSAFMSEELGEGNHFTNTVEEANKMSKQRKKYVSENGIKARFTYGAVKRQRSGLFADEENTASNLNSATTCSEDSKSLPHHPISKNDNINFISVQSKDGSKTHSQANLSSSPANDISLLLNCLSDLQTITFDFSKPSQVQEIRSRPNVVAAQSLAVMMHLPEPIDNSSGAKNPSHIDQLLQVMQDNIEWCIDPFDGITMSEFGNMGKHVLLGHAANCYTIIENIVDTGHKISAFSRINSLVRRTFNICQEQISEEDNQLSDIAYSGVLCIVRMLVNMTHNNPSVCSSMAEQLEVLDQAALHSYQKASLHIHDFEHINTTPRSHEMHCDTLVLSLGVIINIFDGDVSTVSKFISLSKLLYLHGSRHELAANTSPIPAERCDGLNLCAEFCTCGRGTLTSTWIYEALVAHLSNSCTKWDQFITSLSIILGFMIEDSANNNHMHHSNMPEPMLIFLINRIEGSSIEQETSGYEQQLNVMDGSNAQTTIRRLCLTSYCITINFEIQAAKVLMLSDRSRRRLQLLFDENSAGELKFSGRLKAAFTSDTPLAAGELFVYNHYEQVTTVNQPMLTRRRTRGLYRPSITSVTSSQETTDFYPGFNSWGSQQMDATSDPDDMKDVVEPILQKLRLPEEESSQLSQSQLFEHLLAFLQLPLNQLQRMESTPGRSLMISLMQMAKSNSEAFVDGIILPSLSSDVEASRVLTDLITKAISSSISREACSKLTMSINVDRHAMNSSQSQIELITWNSLTSAVMASLLHIKPPLDLSPSVVHNIVYGVRAALHDNHKENAHVQLLLIFKAQDRTPQYSAVGVENLAVQDREDISSQSPLVSVPLPNELMSEPMKWYFHAETTGVHFLFSPLYLDNSWKLLVAYILIIAICWTERLLTYKLDTVKYIPYENRLKTVVIRTSYYAIATVLRLWYMLIAMYFNTGLFIVLVAALTSGQLVVEYRKSLK
ncbi:hypothetical protein INT43_003884, partial [Umbelopsis isabellina]